MKEIIGRKMVPVSTFVFVVALQTLLQTSYALNSHHQEGLKLPEAIALEKQQQQNKLLVKEDLPKCNFIKNR